MPSPPPPSELAMPFFGGDANDAYGRQYILSLHWRQLVHSLIGYLRVVIAAPVDFGLRRTFNDRLSISAFIHSSIDTHSFIRALIPSEQLGRAGSGQAVILQYRGVAVTGSCPAVAHVNIVYRRRVGSVRSRRTRNRWLRCIIVIGKSEGGRVGAAAATLTPTRSAIARQVPLLTGSGEKRSVAAAELTDSMHCDAPLVLVLLQIRQPRLRLPIADDDVVAAGFEHSRGF